jgi:hypothetical protein
MCDRDVIEGYDAPGFLKSRHGPFTSPIHERRYHRYSQYGWHLTLAELDVRDIGGASPFPAAIRPITVARASG